MPTDEEMDYFNDYGIWPGNEENPSLPENHPSSLDKEIEPDNILEKFGFKNDRIPSLQEYEFRKNVWYELGLLIKSKYDYIEGSFQEFPDYPSLISEAQTLLSLSLPKLENQDELVKSENGEKKKREFTPEHRENIRKARIKVLQSQNKKKNYQYDN